MATIGETVNGGTEGSVLFIDSTAKLAQDSNDFVYDEATNTLKSKDRSTAASSNFAVSTGDTTASQNYSSGSLTIDTGDGGTNSTSAAAGSSGNLLLKTGSGGSSGSGVAGSSGSIIMQPGNAGGGGTAGASARPAQYWPFKTTPAARPIGR